MSTQDMAELALIAAAWAAYGALHSWLAGTRLKDWVAARWPSVMPAYRLGFNLIALLLLLPLLWLTWRQPGAPLWIWPAWIAWPLTVVVAAGFFWSLKWYDGAEFLGVRQWRTRDGRDQEALVLSPLHRYVRHPWYALGLLWLWTRDLNTAWLVAALVVTLYVRIGIRLEERKLLARYGEAYARYRERVPALLPWPGRSLSAAEASELQALSATANPPLHATKPRT